jgi:hypothetical protein
MTPSVLVDFIGIENFRSSMGIMVLGQGLTLGLSAPFIGKNKIVKEYIEYQQFFSTPYLFLDTAARLQ